MSFALMLPHGEPYVAAGYTAARPSSPERKILLAARLLLEITVRFIASYGRKYTLLPKSRRRGGNLPPAKDCEAPWDRGAAASSEG